MSRITVRGLAVASATAVTAVGSVVGVASGSSAQNNDAEATAADSTLLADLPAGQQARVQTTSLTQQAEAMAVQADAGARKDAEQAARTAAAKAAKAKKAAAEEREKAKAAAGDPTAGFPVQSSYTVAQIKAIAAEIVGSGQFQCFSNIVDHESTWNYLAVNPSSGAYGLVQALPGNKMASVAADWQTNPATQIKWGLNYMNTTYGSPCQAWAFWQVHHAY
ncbi:transglycosylase SLT domain-containing protein [Streptomyces sp. Ag109_O5-10]|uniref:aggregation-promoting factor C-terminal-like domain-containing protein n=1 Tax=Streptomyces sp. Ag109_O5-10 TaxID=1855349 RepID=UPI0008997AE0|nr:transglycosylase SLT domain-containing protein [Streptomyces sp. Ag109_O5-10]SEF16946.1 Transglycosylase SLT domain-containing protein [Streptomyces sp. Ag109_O5-10]